MLSKIRLDDFKSLSTEELIDLSDYSVFCGANSCGKSSFIQAILMMAQTFSSRDEGVIVLNGNLVRLGSFSEIKNYKKTTDKISIGFSLDRPTVKLFRNKEIICIDFECTFGIRSSENLRVDDEYHPVVSSIKINCLYSEKNVNNQISIIVSRNIDSMAEGGGLSGYSVDYFFDSNGTENIDKEFPSFEIVGCETVGLIPYALNVKYDYTKKISYDVISLISGGNKKFDRIGQNSVAKCNELEIPESFFVELLRCINREKNELLSRIKVPDEVKKVFKEMAKREGVSYDEILNRTLNKDSALTSRLIVDFKAGPYVHSIGGWIDYVESLGYENIKNINLLIDKNREELKEAWYRGSVLEYSSGKFIIEELRIVSVVLTEFFSKAVRYLGPLRNEPKNMYDSQGSVDLRDLGLKGEYTAAILHKNKNKQIKYPSPNINYDEFSFDVKTDSLQVACKEWLSFLGVVSDYSTVDKGNLGYEFKVKVDATDRFQNLTHVGVGVSQVLPIVLLFLLSEPGDLLIFEQPELHLHPKVQSRLSDFFCVMAYFDRQCIIETHSEYIVNRLRLRYAQNRSSNIENKTAVYFVQKDNGESIFKKIEINDYGVVLDWPPGFFDQTDLEIEDILLEASKKRKFEKAGMKCKEQ